MAVDHLERAGYRQVLLVGSAGLGVRDQRFAACAAACAARRIPCQRIDLSTILGGGPDAGNDALLRIMAGIRPPSAAFFHQDQPAAWFRNFCVTNGIRIPEDIGILGVDDAQSTCEAMQPHLSSIVVPWSYLGYLAALELHRQFCGEPPRSAPVLVDPLRVHARTSTALKAATGDPLIDAVIERCRQSKGKSPRLPALARQAGVSAPTLWRRFVSVVGVPPRRYLDRLRMDRFTQALVEEDLPISTLARRFGYGSAKAFRRRFIQAMGISPGEFRKRAFCDHGSSRLAAAVTPARPGPTPNGSANR